MKFPLVLSIFFLFLILSSLHSQEGWRQITTNVGLSSDTIHSLIQSENGDIWIGTDKGIDRYNGIVLSSLYTSSQVDAFSLTGSDIVFARATHLITVSENDLISEEIVATLFFFSAERKDRWDTVGPFIADATNGWSVSQHDRFALYADGKTWVAAKQGIAAYDGQNWQFYHSDKLKEVKSIIQTSDGKLWANSTSLGLTYFNGLTWKRELDVTQLLGLNSYVETAIVTLNDTILLGTNIGLFEYDPILKTISDLKMSSVKVSKIFVASDNSFWVCTEDPLSTKQVLLHLNEDEWNTYLTAQTISTIFEDSDNNMWVGSDQGLHYFDGVSWSKPISDNVNCISELKDGTIIVGTNNGFWIQKNKELIGSVVERAGVRFMGLSRTSDGVVWARSSLGILSYDGQSWTNHGKEKSTWGINENQAFQCGVFEVSDGTIWFNGFISYSYKDGLWQTHSIRNWTQGFSQTRDGRIWAYGDAGVDLYDGENWIDAQAPDLGNRIWAFHESRDGKYWLAGTKGTAYYDGIKWNKVSGDHSSDFYESLDGTLWLLGDGIWKWSESSNKWQEFIGPDEGNFEFRRVIESEDGTLHTMSNWQPGFASFNGKTWSLHPSSKNLSVKLNYRNHMGTGFTEYPSGVFWLATTKGVRRIEGNSWYDLTIEDGLPHDRAFSIIKGDQRGLWIGTEKGLVRYTPPPIHSQPPVVKIRRIDGEYVLDDRIYLTGLSFVTIAWGGGDLKTGDNRLVYQYSIDGQWSDSLKQNTATVGLMNGEHQFSVRAIDHHFNTSAVDSMTIIVKTEAPVLSIINLANGDIVSGEFYIKGRIEDDDFAAFQLFISAIELTKPPILTDDPNLKSPYQLIFEADAKPRTETLAPLKTTDLDDGDYQIWLTAQDQLQHSSVFKVMIRTDNTPPVVKVSLPKANQRILKRVTISAVTSDSHLDSYRLDYTTDLAANDWDQIYVKAGLYQKDESGLLKPPDLKQVEIQQEWEVPIKEGQVWIRLLATDIAGNTNIQTIQVEVPAAIVTRKGGTIAPADQQAELYFPPNTLDQDEIVTVNALTEAEVEPPVRRISQVYDFAPATLRLNSIKPATLTISYDASQLSAGQEPVIFHRTDGPWKAIGGTTNPEQQTISVAVLSLGQYTLGEMDKIQAQASANLKPESLTCQPRVFSPKGNSFSPHTTISFTLDQPANVTIKVYNVAGQLVEWLAQQQTFGSGKQAIRWNGRDSDGEIVATGLYIVTVTVGNQTQDKVVNVWNH